MDSSDEQTPLHVLLSQLIMPPLAPAFNHPFFLALVLTSTLQTQAMLEYTKDHHTLYSIENAFVTRKSATRISTMQALRDLGRVAIQDTYIFSVLQTLLTFAAEHPLSTAWACGKTEGWTNKVDKKGPRTDEYIDHFPRLAKVLQTSLSMDIAYLSSVLASVANQQTAVAEIVTLQDGASMKTIAFITLVFLPATFLATMFATPMFDYDDQVGRVVQRGFWLYWASVGPLTVGVLGAWAGWWWVRGVRRRFDDKGKSRSEDFREWLGGLRGRKGKETEEGVGKAIGVEMEERDEEGYVKLQGTKRRTFLNQFYGVDGEKGGMVGKVGRGSQV